MFYGWNLRVSLHLGDADCDIGLNAETDVGETMVIDSVT